MSEELKEFQNQAHDLRLLKGELEQSRIAERTAVEAATRAEAAFAA